MEFTTVALIVLLGNVNALMALIGVALGGTLVYKTKREPHEPLFASPERPKSAIAEGEHEEQTSNPFGPQEEEDDDNLALGADVMKRNSQFLNLYNEHPQFVGGETSQTEEEDDQREG